MSHETVQRKMLSSRKNVQRFEEKRIRMNMGNILLKIETQAIAIEIVSMDKT